MAKSGKHFLFCILLFASPVTVANVIIPAVGAVYFSIFTYPLILLWVFASESAAYIQLNNSHKKRNLLGLVLIANCISWMAGVYFSMLLPLPYGYMKGVYPPTPQPSEFVPYAIMGVVLAYILSIVIEYLVLKSVVRFVRLGEPFKLSIVANSLSYIGLSLVLVVEKKDLIGAWLTVLSE